MTTETLNDRFEVLRTLDEDGQTRTHLALDAETGQMTVLKELDVGHALDWKSIELFERESKILQHLKHPAIPDYIDAFRTDEDARLFLVQKHIEGHTLESLLSNAAAFTEDDVRDLLEQMLDVLVYLHNFSPPVVHRDLKPSTIVCDHQGQYHLMDFGAVQTIIQDQIGGSTIVGTTGYMPPEQLMGRAEPATDIYALAATCVHLSSGVHPADLPVDMMKLQFRDHVSLSKPICDILEKMLEPDISDRFTRPEQVQEALEHGYVEPPKPHTPSRTPGLPPGLAPPPIISKHTIGSTTMARFDDLNMLIRTPPPTRQISDVELDGPILKIGINIPSHFPGIGLLVTIGTALLMIIGGFYANAFGICCMGFPVLFFGPLIVVLTTRAWGESGFEQITLSPHDIEFISGKKKPYQEKPKVRKHLQLPMYKLRSCYLETGLESYMAYARGLSDVEAPNGPFKKSGIYFIDENHEQFYFRTTGLTKLGKVIGAAPDALPEIEWLFQIVQTYLQIVTPPSDDANLIETETSQTTLPK